MRLWWPIAVLWLGLGGALTTAQADVAKMKESLAKTDSSIKLTKEKIRTAKEIQFLPELYLSLAELLIEKSRLMYAIKIENAGSRPLGELDFNAEKRVKFDAIEALKQIEARYPKFKELDRVLLAIAEEYRAMDENTEALKAYKRLLDQFPESQFWGDAQIGVGNIYYDKKDYEFALQQYQKVLQKLKTGSSAMMAEYKSGLCYMQMDKSLPAMLAFERAAKSDVAVLVDGKGDIREEALLASVKPLSDLGPDDLRQHPKYREPLNYYLKLAPDRAAVRSLLPRLAKRLTFKFRHGEAADVWLLSLQESIDEVQIGEALRGYYTEQKKSKRTMWDSRAGDIVSQRVWNLKNGKRYEPILRDIATSGHSNALKTKRKEDLDLSIENYQRYLWLYPDSALARDIYTNMAEAAFHAERYVQAGEWYRTAARNASAKAAGKGAALKDLLRSGLESLDKAFERYDRLSVLEKTQGRWIYADLAGEFQKRFPQDKSLPDVRFNLAKSLYDGQDFKRAEVLLDGFLKKYPRHPRSSAAAVLLLDCYYLRDDFKGLSAKGKQILALPLEPKVKSEIEAIIKDSTFKRVRSTAGDFASQNYAAEFLKFAEEVGKSELGESALLEAFLSLRTGTDPNAYKIGEQYIGQYGNSDKAKDVFLSLIQMSLAAADFKRGAQYLAGYAQKYPTDPQSGPFLRTSARLFEIVGEEGQAAKVFSATRDFDALADLNFRTQNWPALAQSARQVQGLKGLYLQGLAAFQQKQEKEALDLFDRVATQQPQSEEERNYWAHAVYLVSVREYSRYRSVAASGVTAVSDIKTKGAALSEVDKHLWKVLDSGVGEWVLASLSLRSRLYSDYAQFLKRGPAPKPLSDSQYQKLVAPQIASYSGTAREIVAKCLSVAEEAEIFSEFVQACRGDAKLGGSAVGQFSITQRGRRSPVKQSPKYEEFRKKLLQEPNSVVVLQDFAQAAMGNSDLSTAEALYGRILEQRPDDPESLARLGVIRLFETDTLSAGRYFKSAMAKDSRNPTANWGRVALLKKFSYKNKLGPAMKQAQAAGPAKGVVPPMMK
jgi:tetratricopeptide (TPR) repeat protein